MANWVTSGQPLDGAFLWRVAHHEAAHAVAAVILEGECVSTGLTVTSEGVVKTVLTPFVFGETEAASARLLTRRLGVFMAGAVADRRRGVTDMGACEFDLSVAHRFVHEIAPSCVQSEVLDQTRRVMREIIHDAWSAVTLLADRLTTPPYRLEGEAITEAAHAAGPDFGWLAAIHGPTLDAIADAVTG